MERVRLGKTGLEVTRLGLGGVQLAKIDTAAADRVVRTGLDLGITFLETARGYWDSEEKMGRALRGRRDSVVIATKAGATSAKEMRAAIDASLAALATDYVDLYQCHGCDQRQSWERIMAPGGAMDALLQARQAGKIRAIGFSSHQLGLALEMMGADAFASAQVPISFMNTENHEQGLFDMAREHDVGLIAMKPFGGGRLENARLCMGYVLSVPGLVAAVGVDCVEHVRELAALAESPPVLNAADRQEMQRISSTLGTRFCRACNYCLPCPQDIPIYSVLWLPIYLKQMGLERVLTPERIASVRGAADCIECGQCEERCPFDLDIIDGLRESRRLLQQALAQQAGG